MCACNYLRLIVTYFSVMWGCALMDFVAYFTFGSGIA